ncbi:MAG: bifunctional pyr operon transcriptional regulator/uracil phosphoribosyltransferase, partial [Deltaproteobacteria bacterium]|nr:bifunctional pyr operon transcriptional regulator/uracil phosphoribosyltransferase [Deltaproteobacteria bacterium]
RAIKLAVLVDRGLREYPIQADWTGLTVKTTATETVQMELTEMDAQADRVAVYEREG